MGVGLCQIPVMADAGSSETEAPARQPRLRVVTMNGYGPANPDWDSRHRLLARWLRELDADVVALQEVHRPGLVERPGPELPHHHCPR